MAAMKRTGTLHDFGYGGEGKTPAKKSKAPDESRPYDRNEQRSVQQSWFQEFPWLQDDGTKLYCSWCREAGKKNKLAEGKTRSTIPKKDDLEKHQKIRDHKLVCDARSMKKDFKTATGNAYTNVKDAIEAQMRTALWMAKENVPNSKFKSVIKLQVANGATVFQPLMKQMEAAEMDDDDMDETKVSIRYTHHSCYEDIIQTLTKVLRNEILMSIHGSTFKLYSLCVDESTDVAIEATLMIYLRIVNSESGRVKSYFFKVVGLEGGDAESIHSVISQVLEDNKLSKGNLVCLGTDGASVMQGHRTGVTTRFKQENPFMLSIHCFAHRLALASAKAANDIPYLVQYQADINALYKYYHYSSKHLRHIKEAKNVSGENKFITFKQVFDTRWLSFDGSVNAVMSSLEALLTALCTDANIPSSKARAEGLLKKIGNVKFLGVTYFLGDALHHLAKLCKLLQESNLNFNSARSFLEATVECLELLKETPGPNESTFWELLQEDPTTGRPVFKGHSLLNKANFKDEIRSIRVAFLQKVIENLNNRFPNTEIMNAFSILSPSNLPADPADFGSYGTEKLQILIDHYGETKAIDGQEALADPWIDPVSTKLEWRLIRSLMNKKENQKMSMESFYRSCVHSNRDEFPNMAKIFVIALISPATSVDCERGFSAYNLIKTEMRSKLKIDAVDWLMVLKLEGPGFDSDEFGPFFEKAFHVWYTEKDRRQFHSIVKEQSQIEKKSKSSTPVPQGEVSVAASTRPSSLAEAVVVSISSDSEGEQGDELAQGE